VSIAMQVEQALGGQQLDLADLARDLVAQRVANHHRYESFGSL
jgi:hypothetical protein